MMNLHSTVYSTFDTDPEPIIDFIQWLVQSYKLKEPLAVLDVGCGPGRMLLQYARVGWGAVGMEPEPDFFTQAEEATRAKVNVSVKAGGFADIQDSDAFDLITAINGPFAYLLSPVEQRDAMQRLFKALKPGGVLFLDIPNLLWFLQNNETPVERSKVINGHEVRLLEQREFDVHKALFIQTNEYVVKNPNGKKVKLFETHRHSIITFPDLCDLVESFGFENMYTYNSFESRENEPLTGSRIMLSAQKPLVAAAIRGNLISSSQQYKVLWSQ